VGSSEEEEDAKKKKKKGMKMLKLGWNNRRGELDNNQPSFSSASSASSSPSGIEGGSGRSPPKFDKCYEEKEDLEEFLHSETVNEFSGPARFRTLLEASFLSRAPSLALSRSLRQLSLLVLLGFVLPLVTHFPLRLSCSSSFLLFLVVTKQTIPSFKLRRSQPNDQPCALLTGPDDKETEDR
jgi:hypothetical protein